jgi:hypothetical protein
VVDFLTENGAAQHRTPVGFRQGCAVFLGNDSEWKMQRIHQSNRPMDNSIGLL